MGDLKLNEMPEPLSMPAPETTADLEALLGQAIAHAYTPFPADTFPEDWTVDKVRLARKLHDTGQFFHSKRLERAVTLDARVTSALTQRVMCGLPLEVQASTFRGGKGASEMARAECEEMFGPKSIACPPHVRRRLRKDMVMTGIAIAQVIATPRADGERWDMRVEPWPLEFVTWNSGINRYQLSTTEGLLTIEHGHGKWIIFEPWGAQSWLFGAIRALSMPFLDRAFGIRYRSQHAAAHGSPIPIGQMPQGVPINGPEGKLFQRLLTSLLTRRVAGARPFGSEIKYLEPMSNAWQVFDSIVRNSEEDIALAILGQDGTAKKGTVYTAPMFEGMSFDLMELDLVTIEIGLQTGFVNQWGAINFGVEFTPTIAHSIPDPEEDARILSVTERHNAFTAAMLAYEQAGFDVDDAFAERLALAYGIKTELPKRAPGPAPGAAPPAPAQEPGDQAATEAKPAPLALVK